MYWEVWPLVFEIQPSLFDPNRVLKSTILIDMTFSCYFPVVLETSIVVLFSTPCLATRSMRPLVT
jgi:hypothetical protein